VDDAETFESIYYIFISGGKLIDTIPIFDGWEKTYSNPSLSGYVRK